MEITYIGHASFKIKGKTTTVVIDPYDPKITGYKYPTQTADIVLVTHQHGDHNYLKGVNNYKLVVDTPGEYEISDTFIYGVRTFHDDKEGQERGINTIYQVDIDDFSILHLGDLGHELSKDTLENLSDIDILLIPVGGIYTIDAKTAAKVISSIEPLIIIPMHYQTKDLKLGKELAGINDFLEEMGAENNGVSKTDTLKLNSQADLPEESEIYILSPQH